MDLDEETKRLYYMLSPQAKIEFDKKYESEKKITLGILSLADFPWQTKRPQVLSQGKRNGDSLYIYRRYFWFWCFIRSFGVSQVKHFNESYFRNTIIKQARPMPTDNFIDAPDEEDEADDSIPNVGL